MKRWHSKKATVVSRRATQGKSKNGGVVYLSRKQILKQGEETLDFVNCWLKGVKHSLTEPGTHFVFVKT